MDALEAAYGEIARIDARDKLLRRARKQGMVNQNEVIEPGRGVQRPGSTSVASMVNTRDIDLTARPVPRPATDQRRGHGRVVRRVLVLVHARHLRSLRQGAHGGLDHHHRGEGSTARSPPHGSVECGSVAPIPSQQQHVGPVRKRSLSANGRQSANAGRSLR